MAQNNDRQIISQSQSLIDDVPTIRSQVRPCAALITSLHRQYPHLFRDHHAVDRVDHEVLDVLKVLALIHFVHQGLAGRKAVSREVVLVLYAVLLLPAFPVQALLVTVNVECLFWRKVSHRSGLAGATLSHAANYFRHILTPLSDP